MRSAWLLDILGHLDEANGTTVVVAAVAIGLLFTAARVSKRIPGALVLVILGIATSWVLDLASRGVAITGPVPAGLPSLDVPRVDGSDLRTLATGAAAIFLVAFC